MPTTRALRTLDVILTSDCNLRCRYCYQNAKRPGVMRWPVLRRALRLLLDARHPRPRVFFVGGEPLLAFGLIERAVAYVGARQAPGTGVEFDLSTNGVLLGPRELRFLDAKRFRLQVSCDGGRAAQEMRAPGTFPILDALLDRIRTRHPSLFAERFSVAVTVTPESIGCLADSIAYLLDKGIHDIVVAPCLNPGPGWSEALDNALERQFARLFRSCRRHHARTGVTPLRVFRRRPDAPADPSDWYCGVGSGESLTVDVDGALSGCVTLARSYQRFPATPLGRRLARLAIGSVGDDHLASALSRYRERIEATGVFNHRHRKHSSYGRCLDCPDRAACVVCPVTIAHGSGGRDPDRVPDFVCAFNRVLAKYRRRWWADRPPAMRTVLSPALTRRIEEAIVGQLLAYARDGARTFGERRARASRR